MGKTKYKVSSLHHPESIITFTTNPTFNQLFTSQSLSLPGCSQLTINASNFLHQPPTTNSFKMQFFTVIALALAAVGASACKDDNIFCAPGMGACLDNGCAKRSVDTTHGGFANVARQLTHFNQAAEAKIDAE